MRLHVKIGTLSAQYMSSQKRKPPKVGDVFVLRGLGDYKWTKERVRCCEIKDIEGEPLYFVERW
jgi:hypothetical protein